MFFQVRRIVSTLIFVSFNLYRLLLEFNLSMHSWLMSLEDTYNSQGRLPDTLFHQIDGGCENTARCYLGYCELLVARGMTNKIVLTRLPVGHTHEDIDSTFGILWKSARHHCILSPSMHRTEIFRAFESYKIPLKVVFHNLNTDDV